MSYAAIGLFHPQMNLNVGSVLRAAMCFDARLVLVQGRPYQRAATDTQKAYRYLPLIHTPDLHACVPFDCVPVAVELVDGAVNLRDFVHPKRALYIFGPENGSLGADTLSWCKHVVQVPSRYCLNLAACVNVVLYDRTAKRMKP